MRLRRVYYPICRTRLGHLLAARGLRALRRLGMLRDYHLPVDALELPHEAVAGLMRLWPRIHWAGGDGMMPPQQLLALYRLAAAWPVEGDVVELGAWVGLTTCYLATACEVRGSGIVHAVDTFEGTREGGSTYRSVRRHGGSTYAAFCENVSTSGVSHCVRAHRGLTTEVAQRYDGRPIRFLLIDADHSYEGVLADVAAWSRYLAVGGLMVFHDYLMRDVARAVDETMAGNCLLSPKPGLVDPNVMAVTWRGANDAGTRRRGDTVMPRLSGTAPIPLGDGKFFDPGDIGPLCRGVGRPAGSAGGVSEFLDPADIGPPAQGLGHPVGHPGAEVVLR